MGTATGKTFDQWLRRPVHRVQCLSALCRRLTPLYLAHASSDGCWPADSPLSQPMIYFRAAGVHNWPAAELRAQVAAILRRLRRRGFTTADLRRIHEVILSPAMDRQRRDDLRRLVDELAKLANTRRAIRVTFDNGRTLETEINGSETAIRSYYLGEPVNFGDTDAHPADDVATATAVDFLD